jgi:hypothetical protein
MKTLITRPAKAPSYVFVNNRLEGNALSTIAAVVGEARSGA